MCTWHSETGRREGGKGRGKEGEKQGRKEERKQGRKGGRKEGHFFVVNQAEKLSFLKVMKLALFHAFQHR